MDAADYSIPVYLNQSIVFDLLAIMEDGLAQVSTIRTSETSKGHLEGGVGVSNVFALLGVTLKGGKDKQTGREVTHERVHTPSSLFAKVRSRLHAEKMVSDLTLPGTAIDQVRAGQFVELEATLRQNPLAEALQGIIETISAIKILRAFAKEKVKSPEVKLQEDQIQQVADQSKRILTALTTGGSADLVGSLVPGPGAIVVTTEKRYFAEHAADEIADGRFRVFGKVVRNTSGTEEKINLLRNTQFAHITKALDPLSQGVQAANQSGMALPKVITEVHPPALQLLPVAIFL